jgi:hypothetical protein
MPKYKTVDMQVAELRELADFIEKVGVTLPDYYMTNTLNVYLTETNYARDEKSGEYETTIDEQGTKQNIKKFLDAVGSCDKDYRDDRLVISKNFECNDAHRMIVGTVDRSVACKKVVKGTKFIKEHLIPSRFEEEVEWVCDEGLSLKKLVANI